MKKLTPFLWGTIGGLVVAISLPFLSAAVQTYVIPSTSTGRQTEILTNAPNRDEALRSSFSGSSAPTSPTPVAGQLWFDSGNNLLKVRNGAATAWETIPRLQIGNIWTAAQTYTIGAATDAILINGPATGTARISFLDTNENALWQKVKLQYAGGTLKFIYSKSDDTGETVFFQLPVLSTPITGAGAVMVTPSGHSAIYTGRITTSGVASGTGWSSVRDGTGIYHITWTSLNNANCMATAEGGVSRFVSTEEYATQETRFHIFNDAGTAVDSIMKFVCY